MSYRWGFDLDMAAVRLMRREAGHWREVAVEKIDRQDIEQSLQALAAQVDDASECRYPPDIDDLPLADSGRGPRRLG